jgi:very-short-patch-repair endonuclease
MPVRSLPDVTLGRVPFTVAEARQAGMRWKDLQTRHWTRTGRGQYAWAGLPQDARLKLLAVSLRMPTTYAFSGLTAAWILGLDTSLSEPVEVTIARNVPVRARAGVKLRRAGLPESDVIARHGLRTTSAMRTICDLGSRPDLVEAVVAVDIALHAGLVKLPELVNHVATHAGAKGIKRLRRAVRLAEPRSESPMETRLRIELIRGRLPRPSVQTELCDSKGTFVARVDLYYPDRRLAIEYDGANHKDRLDADLRRQNALLNAGYHVLRFTASDLRMPRSVVAEVRRTRAALGRHPR